MSQVAAGSDAALFLLSSGELLTCGRGLSGCLAQGSTDNIPTPELVQVCRPLLGYGCHLLLSIELIQPFSICLFQALDRLSLSFVTCSDALCAGIDKQGAAWLWGRNATRIDVEAQQLQQGMAGAFVYFRYVCFLQAGSIEACSLRG